MIRADRTDWTTTADVVVVGSGGAALTAGLAAADAGASVVLVEKEAVLGGTTGVSGGVLWVPRNHHLAAAGLEDDRAAAIAYITAIADGRALDPSLIEVFVDTAPEMLEFVEDRTGLRTQIVSNLPDYYGAILDRVPGCKPFSRSVEPEPFDARAALGEWADRIATRSTLLSLGSSTTVNEDLAARGGITANLDELAERERAGLRVKGAALVAALLHACLERGVDVRTGWAADQLVVADDDRIVGVATSVDDRVVAIGARRGVILACGGFEWNQEMVLAHIGYDVKPLSSGGNTGDGLLMAMEAGARLGNMGSYWGNGAAFDPSITRHDGRPMPQMLKGLGPGSVIVNGQGERFMPGGFTYNDFPRPFGHFDQDRPGYPNRPPAWVVFGPGVKEAGPILTMRPGEPAPEWLHRADTVEELGLAIGVDPDRLAATVRRYDEGAARGVDEEWGTTDPRPIDGPPFYALQQWPASLGTNGGPRIDADGRVLGARRPLVEGLYAAGNTSAAVLGGAYLGGGTPIGSGMTFGYRAGRHAAAAPANSVGDLG